MQLTRRTRLTILAICTMACAEESPAGLELDPAIVSQIDDFSFDLVGFADATETWHYTWTNTAPTATVDHASVLTAGSATLTIFDANADPVYSGPVANGDTVGTATGAAGAWIVRVVLTKAAGAVRFRLRSGGYVSTP